MPTDMTRASGGLAFLDSELAQQGGDWRAVKTVARKSHGGRNRGAAGISAPVDWQRSWRPGSDFDQTSTTRSRYGVL